MLIRGRIRSASVTTSRPSTSALPDGRGKKRRKDLDERGLAGAVGAEQAEEFAGADLERDAVKSSELGGSIALGGLAPPPLLAGAIGAGQLLGAYCQWIGHHRHFMKSSANEAPCEP